MPISARVALIAALAIGIWFWPMATLALSLVFYSLITTLAITLKKDSGVRE